MPSDLDKLKGIISKSKEWDHSFIRIQGFRDWDDSSDGRRAANLLIEQGIKRRILKPVEAKTKNILEELRLLGPSVLQKRSSEGISADTIDLEFVRNAEYRAAYSVLFDDGVIDFFKKRNPGVEFVFVRVEGGTLSSSPRIVAYHFTNNEEGGTLKEEKGILDVEGGRVEWDSQNPLEGEAPSQLDTAIGGFVAEIRPNLVSDLKSSIEGSRVGTEWQKTRNM